MDHKVFVFKKISRLSRPTEPSGALESQILVGFQGQECVKSTLGGREIGTIQVLRLRTALRS